MQHGEGYNLVGLKFSRPLSQFPLPNQAAPTETRFFRVKIFSPAFRMLSGRLPEPADYPCYSV